MSFDVKHAQQTDSSQTIRFRLIRGVGSADPNSSFQAWKKTLRDIRMNLEDASEVNWSWQRFIRWPYDAAQALKDETQEDVIDLEFLRQLGLAFRATAVSGLGSKSEASASQAEYLLRAFLWVLKSLPSLLIIAAAAAYFHVAEISLALSLLVAVSCCGVIGLTKAYMRASVAVGFRAVALLLLWPIVFVGVFLLTKPWKWFLIFLVPFLAQIALDSWVPATWLVSPTTGLQGAPSYDPFWRDLLLKYAPAYIGVLISLAVFAVIYRRLRKVFSPLLKILADVVFYLGNSEYQRCLLDMVTESLEKPICTECGFVLLCHSLGTVIAVDVLRSRWEPADVRSNVLLITGGSPLARLFHRFFPARYPSPSELYGEIRSRISRFRWLNVFRENDPIGAELGLPDNADINADHGKLSWLNAHLDYWSDSHIHTLVRQKLASDWTQTMAAKYQLGETVEETANDLNKDPGPGEMSIRWLILAIFSCVVLQQLWSGIVVPLVVHSANQTQLAANGVKIFGRLYRHYEVVYSSENYIPALDAPRYTLEFTPPGGSHAVTTRIFFPQCRPNAMWALFENGKPQPASIPISGWKGTFIPVDVTYMASSPSIFSIQQCAYRVTSWSLAGALTWLTSSLALLTMTAYGVIRYFLLPTLAAFVALSDSAYKNISARAHPLDAFLQTYAYIAVAWALAGLLWLLLTD